MIELWQKPGALGPDAEMMRFTVGDDRAVDAVLLPFDVRASVAHVRGLGRIGVLSPIDAERLAASLVDVGRTFERGDLTIDERFEDGHSALEHALVERLGDLGKRVHTGRSRNDQVQVALRLYAMDRLSTARARIAAAAEVLLARAAADERTPMPGYTHLKRAVPSSVGLWLAGIAEGLIDDLELVGAAEAFASASPLGTGAGFGVNLALDREGVARELGFARVAWNPMNVQNARGKTELVVLGALESALLDARRFAWDLSFFVNEELGFAALPDEFTTGSSLMPNKRNPDAAELLRAAYASVLGARTEIAATLSLPSGYHRDLQRTKSAFVRGVEGALAALSIFARLAGAFTLDPARMRACIDGPMFATDRALELARAGTPFRDAYREVGVAVRSGASAPADDVEASLAARVSPGACADLRLDDMRRRLTTLRRGAGSSAEGGVR